MPYSSALPLGQNIILSFIEIKHVFTGKLPFDNRYWFKSNIVLNHAVIRKRRKEYIEFFYAHQLSKHKTPKNYDHLIFRHCDY